MHFPPAKVNVLLICPRPSLWSHDRAFCTQDVEAGTMPASGTSYTDTP